MVLWQEGKRLRRLRARGDGNGLKKVDEQTGSGGETAFINGCHGYSTADFIGLQEEPVHVSYSFSCSQRISVLFCKSMRSNSPTLARPGNPPASH